MLELKLFGIPKLFWNKEPLDLPSTKSWAMLCYLATKTEQIPRTELTELLWGTTSTGSFRVALSELRALAGSENWLLLEGNYIQIKAKTDLGAFEAAVNEKQFVKALSLWQDVDTTLLKGLEVKKAPEFMNWLEIERQRLKDLYAQVLVGRIAELGSQKQFDTALDLAQELLRHDPLNEESHRTIMRLEYARGNKDGALQQFEHLRQILKDELGVEPLPETLALLREIEQSSISEGKWLELISKASQLSTLPEKLFGRDSLLKEIDEKLKAKKQVLLQGFGGTGKTALAASFAKLWLEQTGAKLAWLQAGDDSFETLLGTICRAFHAQEQLAHTDNKSLLKDLLRDLDLFILDDAWNSYALSKLLEVLPTHLSIIVTSRQRQPKLERIDVSRLERQDALKLLWHHASLLGEPETRTGDDALCQLLGDHPFALRIAGIRLGLEKLSPLDLLEDIKDQPHAMKTPADFSEQNRESVAALLASSSRVLSDEAYELLLALGSLHSTRSTAELLAFVLRRSENDIEEAFIELHKRGLAERLSQAGHDQVSYLLHDLIFSFSKANTNLRNSTIMRAAKRYLDKYQHDFSALDCEIANLLGAVQTAQLEKPELFLTMMQQLCVGDAYYQARGHSQRSLKLMEEASILAESKDDKSAAHYLYARIGDCYRSLYANYDRAFVAYDKALDLARTLNDSHREAISLSLLAIVLFEQGKDSDEYFDQAYNLAKITNDTLALSNILQHRGYVAGHKENWLASRNYSYEAIEIARQAKQDGNHSADINHRLFFSLLNLGEAARKLDDFKEALAARQQALNIAKEVNNQLWMAYALQEIGEMYHDTQRYQKAYPFFYEALELYEVNHAHADIEHLRTFLTANPHYDQLQVASMN